MYCFDATKLPYVRAKNSLAQFKRGESAKKIDGEEIYSPTPRGNLKIPEIKSLSRRIDLPNVQVYLTHAIRTHFERGTIVDIHYSSVKRDLSHRSENFTGARIGTKPNMIRHIVR